MPTYNLSIVPVKLEPLTNETSSNNSPGPSCVIKTVTAEISFFNGVEERIIQMIMKELNSR